VGPTGKVFFLPHGISLPFPTRTRLPPVPHTRAAADLATRASPPPGIRAAASPQPRRRLPSMDGDGFNAWGSQPSASCPGHAPASLADLDLNSQAPAVEVFPGLGLYGAVLQGNVDELLPGRVRSSVLPPYRPPRAGAGDAWATMASPYARQLHFGGSSSSASGRGGGNGGVFPGGSSSGAGGVRQHTKSSGAVPGRQRTNTALRGGGGQRTTRRSVAAAASAYRVPEHRGHRGVPSVGKHPAPALPSTSMKNWRMMWRS